jgi:DNA-binding response OmpR family regulator
MNGKELLANLKEDASLAEIPVIMLTSDDDVEAEVSLLQRGAAAFISKGKDPRILISQIRRLAQRGNLSEAA